MADPVSAVVPAVVAAVLESPELQAVRPIPSASAAAAATLVRMVRDKREWNVLPRNTTDQYAKATFS